MSMLTEALFMDMNGKLNRVLRILAIDIVRGIKKGQGRIERPDSFGSMLTEISTFPNSSHDNINVELGNIRNKKEWDRAENKGTSADHREY